eukprot:1193765-Prorocentrum_minimum.AAC.1
MSAGTAAPPRVLPQLAAWCLEPSIYTPTTHSTDRRMAASCAGRESEVIIIKDTWAPLPTVGWLHPPQVVRANYNTDTWAPLLTVRWPHPALVVRYGHLGTSTYRQMAASCAGREIRTPGHLCLPSDGRILRWS